GVDVNDKLVLDMQNSSFPIPVIRDLGGLQVQEIRLLPYPFFVSVRQDGMQEGSATTRGLPAVTLHWPSPIVATTPGGKAKEKEETGEKTSSNTNDNTDDNTDDNKGGEVGFALQREVLLRSSERSWTQASTKVQPDFDAHPELGFPRPSPDDKLNAGPFDLGIALTGTFESYFRDATAPPEDEPEKNEDGTADTAASASAKDKDKDKPVQIIRRSPAGTRLVVIGSSTFVDDDILDLERQTGSDQFLGNLRLVENLLDWAVSDVDLLAIRSRGNYTRMLEIAADERGRWEWINYLVAAIALLVVAGVSAARRRAQSQIALVRPPAATTGGRGDGGEASDERTGTAGTTGAPAQEVCK
ncbi:MAG: hypothetical protein V2A73_15000, partial [Pseudomonadota bacterium]